MHILEAQSKIVKMCFLVEIKAFEVVGQNICILRREYLSSGVNVLKNSKKISDMTKADFFQLNLSRIRGNVGK